jgi:4'-phosphopantetheinyl transferase
MIHIYYAFAKGLNESDFDFMMEDLAPEVKSKLFGLRQSNDRLLLLMAMALLSKTLKDSGVGYGVAEMKYNFRGRPYFEGASIDFNYSHTNTCVVMAWSESCRIGVDVEAIHPVEIDQYTSVFSPPILKKIQRSKHPHLSFFRYWTQLESVLKADGRGLPLVSLAQIQVNMRSLERLGMSSTKLIQFA